MAKKAPALAPAHLYIDDGQFHGGGDGYRQQRHDGTGVGSR